MVFGVRRMQMPSINKKLLPVKILLPRADDSFAWMSLAKLRGNYNYKLKTRNKKKKKKTRYKIFSQNARIVYRDSRICLEELKGNL